MLILGEGEIYMVDRDNAVFKAPQFRFPQRKNPKEHVFDTLLDGVRIKDSFSILSVQFIDYFIE